MQEGAIPTDIGRKLESASHHGKCQEMRTIAQTVQNRVATGRVYINSSIHAYHTVKAALGNGSGFCVFLWVI